MVQRVPAHLGETTSEAVSPWVMVAGVALLILVVCAVLFVLLGGGARFGIGVSATATPTRTRTATPALTILPITLATPSPSVGPTAATVKYKVKSGDTLSGIASKYKVPVQAIMTANGLKDDNIRIGDDLIIPLPTPTLAPTTNSPPSGATPTPISFQSPPTSASPAVTPGVIHYSVKRGDTISSIASTFGSTIDGIRAANQLDSDLISIGQDLIVPVGSWTPTPTIAPTMNATATPTSQFTYAAPDLIWPPNNFILHGKAEAPTLSWTSPATLKSNEFYIVHVEYVSGGINKVLPALSVKQGTSIKLDATTYPGANPNGTLFSWYVVIVSQANGARSAIASSPASQTWTFVWY
jgi:LysM repeat protein